MAKHILVTQSPEQQWNSAVRDLELMTKSMVRAYTRKDGTLVKEHDSGRTAAKAKPAPAEHDEAPDHGHMRFSYRSGGNHHILHVNSKRIFAGGGPDQRTRMALSNYTFNDDPWKHGAQERERRLKTAIRDAYNSSGGDPKKVLQAIKNHTKLHDDSWSLHSHTKPDA